MHRRLMAVVIMKTLLKTFKFFNYKIESVQFASYKLFLHTQNIMKPKTTVMMNIVTGTAIQMCGFQGKNPTCLQPNFGSSGKVE